MNNDENKEKWQAIVFHLTRKCTTEIIFQEKVAKAIDVLGYKEHKNEIKREHSIPVGSSKFIKPDFLISVSNEKLFVIEVKLSYTEKSSQQLFSYMRLLNLQYGLLIAEDIKIFYDDYNTRDNPPILLKEIKLIKDNIDGIGFVEVFQKKDKDVFFTEIKNYKSKILEEKENKELEKIIKEKILNDDFTEGIKSLIKKQYANEYKEKVISSALDDLEIGINIRDKEKAISNKDQYSHNNSTDKTNVGEEKRTVNGLKIGAYVQKTVTELLEKYLIPQEEIRHLLNKDYSKKTFKIWRSFLAKEKDIDNFGYYYRKKIQDYHLYSEWSVRHWDNFLAWEKRIRGGNGGEG